MNSRFLNVVHKMVQILQQWFIGRFRKETRGYLETCEPQI